MASTSNARILVLGGTGAVGGPLVAALRSAGHDVVVASRRVGGGTDQVRLDLRQDLAGLEAASEGAGAVVNASGLELPALAHRSRAPFVDLSATPSYLRALADDPGPAGVVVGVGLAPGLTTLLARSVAGAPDEEPEEVDVLVMLGVGEHHGPAARQWTAGMLGTDFPETVGLGASGNRVRSFSAPRLFAVPGRAPVLGLRADFPDGVFPDVVGARVRSYLGLTSRAATLALGVASRAPRLLGPLLQAPLPGSDAWALVAVNRTRGTAASVSGRGQSAATALLAALTVERTITAGIDGGAHHAADLTTLAEAVAVLPRR